LAVFVPVDDTDAFADKVLTLLTGGPQEEHQADTDRLTLEWDRYRQEFLAIISVACDSPATLPAPAHA
jgi:hypothetical protein